MLYLHLFHGRKSRTEHLDDWGSDGPTLRISGYHVTYGSTINLRLAGTGDSDWFDAEVRDGLLYYDGVWYGDWSISDQDIGWSVCGSAALFTPVVKWRIRNTVITTDDDQFLYWSTDEAGWVTEDSATLFTNEEHARFGDVPVVGGVWEEVPQ